MTEDALARFHPLVRQWFTDTLGEPSLPQQQGWPIIARGDDALILAPTGTGKTLAAFLYELDALIRDGADAPLANAVHLLYISPLKALSNDVQRNLERPLAELRTRFIAAGVPFPDIRVAVRTGDTSPAARARMVRKTPHILITTPESLHLLLTSGSGRTMFSALRAVIIDEIHAVAGTKRGAHLALTLERLAQVAPAPPQRIGLSATQRPLEEIARFLGGCAEPAADGAPRFRPVNVVDCGLVKRMETAIVSPVPDLAQVDGSIWFSVVPLVLEQIRSARTTLVFVNNRGQAERMAARVNAAAGEEIALPYHGSLSRERRFLLEEQLKAGALRALVTTSSLELGIDVGSVDLVLQLQSPKRVAAGLQRVGRAGHTLHAVSRGIFVPTFRDDAMELMAIVSAMAVGDVEPTRVVQNALDVLAQLIVAIVASETPAWTASDLYHFVRHAYPWHQLTRTAFDETLAMLAGRYPADVAAELEARVHWDRVSDELTPSRAARMLATISGGTIPDRGLYAVFLADKTRLGELDEEFVHESRVGDAFQLGSSTWRIRAIEHDRVVVAPGAPARMPFWHGEFMARSRHLTPAVGQLRRDLGAASTETEVAEIGARYHADTATVQSVVDYVRVQREVTGIVPDERHLVLEHFRDETGSVRMVLHAPFGGRVNAPWGMALARKMRARLGVDVQVQTTDDALMLRLPNLGADAPVDVFRGLGRAEAEELILEEVGTSSLFGARFRMNAARALLLPRGNPRKRMPLWLQRLKATDLLESVRQFPSFPIVVETYRDVLQDAFDMEGLAAVLNDLGTGAITLQVVQTTRPSPFAQSLQFGFVIDWLYVDDTPRAEARAALLSLDRVLLEELLGGEGADDATLGVLQEVLARRRGTAPGYQARDLDELAVLVDRAGDLTREELRQRVAPSTEWSRGDPLDELLASGRLIGLAFAGDERFLLVDTFARYAAAFDLPSRAMAIAGVAGDSRPIVDVVPEELRRSDVDQEIARRDVLARWTALAGPVTSDDAARRFQFDAQWVEDEFEQWERSGQLVRGVFGGDRSVARWCWRRTLERARRLELKQARDRIEAVSISAFTAFLQRWQHLTDETRLRGEGATAAALAQLYGIARPGLEWERAYLPDRVADYEGRSLDAVAATGRVSWAAVAGRGKSARVRFFARGTGRMWLPVSQDLQLSPDAELVRTVLRENGASFTEDLATATGLSANKLRDAIHELVMAGVVTNDSADGLRAVLRWRRVFPTAQPDAPDPARWLPDTFVVQRRPNIRRLGRWQRPELAGPDLWNGRWALLHAPGILGPEREEAELAEAIARQWLSRYGIVSRDWWRRERPAVGWRAIYSELKRLEFRGDVQRGYFVSGLAGAQFALPEAVELLRSVPGNTGIATPVVIAASDPSRVEDLPSGGAASVDSLARPRGAGLMATIDGVVVMYVEGAGTRLRVREGLPVEQAPSAISSLVAAWMRRQREGRARDFVVETINGEAAAKSPFAEILLAAGFRHEPAGLRYRARAVR